MIKRFMLVLAILLVSACGKKSVIKSNVEAQPLRNTISVVIPLSEKVISSFNSTTDDVNPLLRGLVNTFMNLGASMGAGLTHLTLVQPLPEIPRELVSLKIKRVFFFIEPKDKQESFKFLDMLAVKLSSANIDKTNGYEPSVDTNSKKKRKIWNYLESFFDLRSEADYVSWEKHTEGLPLIKYIQKHRRDYLINSDRRNIYLLQTKKPGETRNYLETNLGPLFDRIHNLNKSIYVEVKNDPVSMELFNMRVGPELKDIHNITPCDPTLCLDLKVPNVDILPMLRTGNALKMEAFIDPKNAPKTFQLKGFIEFEVKADLPF